MLHRSLRSHRPLLLLIALLAGMTGCRLKSGPTAEGPLSIPPQSHVRIVSRRITQTPEKLHWKWSLIGERNWTEARASETEMALSKTYALNDPLTSGGCNIWECDLIAERTTGKGAKPSLRWRTILHGSDGTTREGKGTLPIGGNEAGVSLSAAVRILVDKDALQRLPAETVLARVADREVTLRVSE